MLTICTQIVNRIFRSASPYWLVLHAADIGQTPGDFPTMLGEHTAFEMLQLLPDLLLTYRQINQCRRGKCTSELHRSAPSETLSLRMFLAEYFRHNLLLNIICMHFLYALSVCTFALPDRLTRIIVFVKSVLMWNASLACKQASCFEHLVILLQAPYYSLVHSTFNPQLVYKLLPMNTHSVTHSVTELRCLR